MSPILRLIIFVYEPDCTKFRQRIGFSTQNNTILWNQVRTKILPALKRLQAVKQIILFIATQQINKHTDQLISVNALGLAHKTNQVRTKI
jgi:hypothetical protein